LIISIDDIHTLKSESYNRLIKLCDTGKFDKALSFAEELYPDYKQSSELNRIIAQMQLSKNNTRDAEHYLIEALKLNPKNTNVLILMGNYQYQIKELNTALLYWNSALRFNPDDYLALSNIGSTLARDNHLDKAKYFFEQALEIEPTFSNALLGLGIINHKEKDFSKAFDLAFKVLKSNPKESALYSNAYNLAMNSAKELSVSNTEEVEKEIKALRQELENLTGKPVKIETNDTIQTPAKIIIAEYHNKDHHQLYYKNTDITVQHLILHELYHLKLVADARKTNSNMLFTSDEKHQDAFFKANQKYIKKLTKKGLPQVQIDQLITSVFQGLNSQMYNTPIDLFIEDLIFKNHPIGRAVQCISLVSLAKQGVNATTSEQIVKSFPNNIITKSKILNLVNALHLKDLYAIDMIEDFKPKPVELNQANTLYDEFKEYRNDKEPAEEYEIIQHWAEDLKVDKYFKLQPETVKTSKTPEEVLDEVNKDPYGLDSPEPQYKIDDRQKFIDQHATKETNKAVTYYMIGALSLLKEKPVEEVKAIAMEFAKLGMTGINPNKKNYEVPSLNKKMSGYQTLAYYYVSWAIAIPEMLSQLQLPFDKEYAIALKMTK
jgi:tetratricopeptide (TPR) repeat protein